MDLSKIDFYKLKADTIEGDKKVTMGSGAVILVGNEVLLIDEMDRGFSTTGGAVMLGESIIDACKREVKEEIGFEITEINEEPFLHVTKRPDHYVILFYFVQRLPKKPEIIPAEEITDFGWFDVNNLPNDVLSGVREAVEYFSSESP